MTKRKLTFKQWIGFTLVILCLPRWSYAAPPGTVLESTGDANQDVENLYKLLQPVTQYAATDVDWRKKPRVDKCLQDENQYVEIENSLIDAWRSSWATRDFKKFSALVTPSFSQTGFGAATAAKSGGGNGIRLLQWQRGKTASLQSIQTYLGRWKTLDDVELATVDFDVAEKWRSSHDLNYDKADLRVRFDLRGLAKDGKRQNDRGILTARVERKSAKSEWRLVSLTVGRGETAVLDRQPAFVDRTQASGLGDVPVELRREAIRRGGFAVAVSDLNGDGKPDLYVGGDSGGSVWFGDGNGHFSRQKNHPLEKEAAVKTAIFADFRNSGANDAFMTRFIFGENLTDLVYYDNKKDGFKKVDSFVKGKYQYRFAMPATTADFNKDGYLDLYVGFPGQRDFTHLGKEEAAETKYPQGIFLNAGKNAKQAFFLDASDSYWKDWKHLGMIGNIYPHSALAVDYDRDGNPDLLVVDDRMNVSPIYHNVDGKRFEAVQEDLKIENRGFGMGVAAGDLDNDGYMDIAVTNVNSAAAARLRSTCSKHWHITAHSGDFDGLRLFKGLPEGKYQEVTQTAGLEWAGEGLAGVEFIDYDNDGLMDIYVSNGLWSGSERKVGQDLSSLFNRAVFADKAFANQIEDTNDYKNLAFLNILRHYTGDITGEKKANVRPSMAGWQRNRLFHNDGNGHFTEVGYLEGVDSVADGYVIAKGDINQDGRMDLILRNADPGTKDYQFPAIQYFENVYPNKKSLILTFKGTKSNRNGVGALIEVQTGDKTQYGQLVANNGSAQSEMLAHFGLGQASVANRVHVRWPSGTDQTFTDMKAGRYLLEEGREPVPNLSVDLASARTH